MRRCDRYLFNELLLPFFIGVFALIMMMVGTTLYNLLESLLRDKLPLIAVLRVLALKIPEVLVLALPVATALAVSLAVNRLARDNEINVLRASGIPLWRVFLPIMCFGAMVSGADFWISDQVVPWASKEQQNVQFALDSLPKNPIEMGLTIRRDNYTITFNSFQKMSDTRRRLNKVIIIEQAKRLDEYPMIITADYADYENGLWTSGKVRIHRYNKDGIEPNDVTADNWKLTLPIDFSQAYRSVGAEKYLLMSYAELTHSAEEARHMGQLRDAVTYEVERWFKLSLPAMCFVFALCAPGFALRFSKGGSFTGVMLSIVIVFVAWNTFLLMKYIGLGGLLPPWAAAWSTDLLFTIIGLWLLRIQE